MPPTIETSKRTTLSCDLEDDYRKPATLSFQSDHGDDLQITVSGTELPRLTLEHLIAFRHLIDEGIRLCSLARNRP